MGEEIPARQDFEQWLKPRDALELLPIEWGRGHALNAIITNLKVVASRANARTGRLSKNGELVHVSFYILSLLFWDELSWINGPEAFGQLGKYPSTYDRATTNLRRFERPGIMAKMLRRVRWFRMASAL